LRALITGITGFAGSHLAEYLLRTVDAEVYGVSLAGECLDNLAGFCDQIQLFGGNLRDSEWTARVIQDVLPDQIYHLAAQAAVSVAWAQPGETLVNNVLTQLNVLEASAKLEPMPRVLVIGSGDEYGLAKPEELPLREDSPLRPNNPYSVSKIMQDYLGYQYYLSHGLPVVRLRPFNHIGPRQRAGFVVPDFAKQIAEAEARLREPVIRVGNLSARRDFTDVRDIVRGYTLALEKGEPGEVYNLGSGDARSVKEILGMLLELSSVQVRLEQDPARMRPSDVPELVCDSGRFRAHTGWKPGIPIQQTLADVLDYWRKRVAGD
jgi:GDP-4-dehydro-6-deoxy-D-mannose reductase